jgi:hypothetical protein
MGDYTKFKDGQFFITKNPSTQEEALVRLVFIKESHDGLSHVCLVSFENGYRHWIDPRALTPCEHSDLMEELDSIGSL